MIAPVLMSPKCDLCLLVYVIRVVGRLKHRNNSLSFAAVFSRQGLASSQVAVLHQKCCAKKHLMQHTNLSVMAEDSDR